MLNNNHKSCHFAEQTVSYLYGESAASEKTEFESHLKTCSTCADELESFGFVRSAVLDWRNEDFAKMQAPAFDIPAIESENSFSPATNPTESRSWFGGFGKIFSFNPALAAFAVLVVCFGAALFAFKFPGGGGEIAGNKNDANLAHAASPTVEAALKSETMNSTNEDFKKSLPSVVKAADSRRQAARERQIVSIKPAVKVSDSSPKINAGSSARNLKDGNDSIKKPAPVKKQLVPNLNDAEDEEDKTIRLADLFDEIDAR